MPKRPPRGEVVSILRQRVQGPVLTVSQMEEKHPALRGRLRGFILRADLGLNAFVGLSDAVFRLGRSILLDEARVLQWLETRTHQPRSRGRNPHGRAGAPAKK